MTQNILQTTLTIATKEIQTHFKTKRLLVIGIIFLAVFIIISIWGGYITAGSQEDPTYEEGAEAVITMVLGFSTIFPPILAVALTYDSIVGERVNNSMYLLVSKPIRKEAVYLGKFLGALISIGIIYLGVTTIGYLIILGLSGTAPNALQVLNVYAAVLFILIGVAAWITMVMLFSTLFKTIASSLITSVLFWLFVLNLISQAGLIYWAATAPSANETSIHITYSPVPGSTQSIVTASGFNPELGSGDITLTLKDENDQIVGTEFGGMDESISSVLVSPGNYTWEVTDEEDDTIEKGTIKVQPNAMLTSMIYRFDDDDYNNDYLFTMTDNNNMPFSGGEYILSKDGVEVERNDTMMSIITFNNLSQGWYDFEFILDGEVILEEQIYSYGEILSGNLFARLTTLDEELPGYVKFMLAVNPSNAVSSYGYFLDDDYEGILTLQESTLALVMFLGICGTLGVVTFKKKELG